jgi:hypothetical protein
MKLPLVSVRSRFSANDLLPRVLLQQATGRYQVLLADHRDDDHLQGIFRVSYDLLKQSGKDATWVSWNHPLHGYIFPEAGPGGTPAVDDVQERAIDGIIEFLDRHLG